MEITGQCVTRCDGLAAAHFVGGANEYVAAIHFLKSGYQVFWPSVQQGHIDFVIYDGEVFQRVQVKTATWAKTPTTEYKYLQCRLRLGSGSEVLPSSMYDLLACVTEDSLWVIPANELDHSSNICLTSSNAEYKPRGKCYSKWRVY